MKAKFECRYWLCHVSKVVTCEIELCHIVLSLKNTHNTRWSAPHNHMLPRNLPKLLSPNSYTLGTKIKRVIARWIALLIMEDSAL